jgi:hypothetical protein
MVVIDLTFKMPTKLRQQKKEKYTENKMAAIYVNEPPPPPLIETQNAITASDHPLDFLIGNRGLESDMAKVFHRLHPKLFQYYGDNHWRWYDSAEGKWINDNGKTILEQMRCSYSHLLIQRAYYWQTLSCQLLNKLEEQEASRNAEILLIIQQDWMNKQLMYSKNILKELKIYYIVKEVD